jgi:hypothetical protein
MRGLSYYADLIMPQHQAAAKFKAWVAANVQIWVDIGRCADGMNGAFALNPIIEASLVDNYGNPITTDTGETLGVVAQAEGVQLDIIGQWIGRKRELPFDPTGGVSPIMTDATYRLALIAKAGINQWDGKTGSLNALWAALFPGGRLFVADNMDMTMTVTLYAGLSQIAQDLITHGMIVPKPEGVRVNYVYDVLPYFGADRNDGYIGGPDYGYAS